MRRVIFCCFIALAAGSALSSCGTNTPPPVYVEATWQVRCLRFDGTPMTSGCTEPPVRAVFGYNGTDRQQVTCSIRESGANRTINFRAAGQGADGVAFSIGLANAIIPAGGGTPAGACNFTFAEGNTYSAPCGGLEPSPAQPCQVRNIEFGELDGSSTMQVDVYCIEAPATADSTIHRGATLPGSGSGQEMEPFPVTFYDCPVTGA
jgi:hypothetical protein